MSFTGSFHSEMVLFCNVSVNLRGLLIPPTGGIDLETA
jgi:hypothetical protein